MLRRAFLSLTGSLVLLPTPLTAGDTGPPNETGKPTLASAPIDIKGDWGGSLPGAALTVVTRMRDVSLAGVRLLSDRQPGILRVDSHTSGPPAIWLHDDGTPIAWIIVDVGPRDWSKLAYQFGHELGHVLCNSWGPEATPANPCQWLEEALVEAFSIRGLGLLAESWERQPPFAGDAAFGAAIRRYREDLLASYQAFAATVGADRGLAGWFAAHRAEVEADGGVLGPGRAAVPALVELLGEGQEAVEGLGALNRWAGRSGVAMEEYLRLWERSCREVGADSRSAGTVKNKLLLLE